MIRVFDFKCPDGHVTEHFVDSDETTVRCPYREVYSGVPLLCDHVAVRQLAAPRAQLEGFSGAFPGAADKWERNRESHMRKERKNQEKHGTYK